VMLQHSMSPAWAASSRRAWAVAWTMRRIFHPDNPRDTAIVTTR